MNPTITRLPSSSRANPIRMVRRGSRLVPFPMWAPRCRGFPSASVSYHSRGTRAPAAAVRMAGSGIAPTAMRGRTPPFRTPHEKLRAAAHIFRGGYGLTVHAVSPWPRMPRSAPWATARHRAARRSPQRNAPSRTTSSAHEHLWSISEHLPTGVRDARPARAAAPRKRRPHDDRGAGPLRRAAGRAGAFGFAGALTARIERENAPGGAAVSVAEGTGTDALLHGQAAVNAPSSTRHAQARAVGLGSPVRGAGIAPNQVALHGGCAGIRAPAECGLDGRHTIARTAMRGRMPPFRNAARRNCGRRPTFFPAADPA